MTKVGWRVWLVFAALVVAQPVAAGENECFEQMDGTLCGDRDDNPCTRAACDNEECDQNVPAGAGAPCCTDGTNPDPAGSECPDTDGDICSSARCNAAGDCNQTSSRADDGTECEDTDGDPNTVAACMDGACNQNFGGAPASAAPALSTMGGTLVVGTLMALGYRRLRRSK